MNNYILSARGGNINTKRLHQSSKGKKSEYIPLEDYYSVYDESSFLYKFFRKRKNYEYILNYSANILISFRRNSIIFKERIGFNILIISFRRSGEEVLNGSRKNYSDLSTLKIIDKWSLNYDYLDTSYKDLFNFFNVYKMKKWLFPSKYITKKWLFNSFCTERPQFPFIAQYNSVLKVLSTGEIVQEFVDNLSKKQLRDNRIIFQKSFSVYDEELDKYYYSPKFIDMINTYNHLVDEKKDQKYFYSSIKSRLRTSSNGRKKFIYENIIILYFYWTISFTKWFYIYYIKILFITWTRFLYSEFNGLYINNIFYNYYLYRKLYLYVNNIRTFSIEQYSYFYSDRYKNMGIRSPNIFKNQRFWILDSLSLYNITDFTRRKFNIFFLFIKKAKRAKGYNVIL